MSGITELYKHEFHLHTTAVLHVVIVTGKHYKKKYGMSLPVTLTNEASLLYEVGPSTDSFVVEYQQVLFNNMTEM